MLTFGVGVGWSPVTQGGWTWTGVEPPAQQEYPSPTPIRRGFPDGMQGGSNVDLTLRQSGSGLGPCVSWECADQGWVGSVAERLCGRAEDVDAFSDLPLLNSILSCLRHVP